MKWRQPLYFVGFLSTVLVALAVAAYCVTMLVALNKAWSNPTNEKALFSAFMLSLGLLPLGFSTLATRWVWRLYRQAAT
jgi:hypothetical protein